MLLQQHFGHICGISGITVLWVKVFAWSWCYPGHVSTAMQPCVEQTPSQEPSPNIPEHPLAWQKVICPSPMG